MKVSVRGPTRREEELLTDGNHWFAIKFFASTVRRWLHRDSRSYIILCAFLLVYRATVIVSTKYINTCGGKRLKRVKNLLKRHNIRRTRTQRRRRWHVYECLITPPPDRDETDVCAGRARSRVCGRRHDQTRAAGTTTIGAQTSREKNNIGNRIIGWCVAKIDMKSVLTVSSQPQ